MTKINYKLKKKSQPLPPGTYNATVEKVRKVRNKDMYDITLNINNYIATTPVANRKETK